MFVYRELRWRDLYDVLATAAETTAVVMFLVAAAMVSAWLITIAELPGQVAALLEPFMGNKTLLMLAMMVFVVIVGTALDMLPTILILTPVLMPIVKQAGIDPIYFGVLFIINNAIGLLTPPVGTVLNVVCGGPKIKMDDIIRGVWPFMIAQLLVLLLLILFPSLVIVPAPWLGGWHNLIANAKRACSNHEPTSPGGIVRIDGYELACTLPEMIGNSRVFFDSRRALVVVGHHRGRHGGLGRDLGDARGRRRDHPRLARSPPSSAWTVRAAAGVGRDGAHARLRPPRRHAHGLQRDRHRGVGCRGAKRRRADCRAARRRAAGQGARVRERTLPQARAGSVSRFRHRHRRATFAPDSARSRCGWASRRAPTASGCAACANASARISR